MPKVLFQLYLDIDQFKYIQKKSEKTKLSRAAIVREWVEKGMKEEEKQKAK